MIRFFSFRNIFSITLVLLVFVLSASAQNSGLYWYENGAKVYWHTQNDVVAFKTTNVNAYDQLNERGVTMTLQIKPVASEYLITAVVAGGQIESIRETVKSIDAAAVEVPVITQFPAAAGEERKWVVAGSEVIIRLNNETKENELSEILDNEQLTVMYHKGDLVIVRPTNPNINTIDLSVRIYEANPGKITSAGPNRLELFRPHVNDTHISKAWHIDNTGQSIFCNNKSGSSSADAKITDVWNSGIKGGWANVAVIDFYGFDFNHPDLNGNLIGGWDCIQNKSYDPGNFYFTDATNAHGTAVAGLIAAIANNNEGAAGVAPDSRIIPLLIDGSEASVIIALQKAIELNADVVNMSFGSYYSSTAIYNEIRNGVNTGRVEWGQTYGCVYIASAGNDYKDDAAEPQYPAAYEEVISVGATTPDDLLKKKNDGWDSGSVWGSNYGDNIDVSAPGVCLFTTDISGANGYSASSDYIGFYMTSAAAPVVSGVAALVISKNLQLTWQEVQEKIRQGADKTGGYNYSHNSAKPGHSRELGYGRVNALKSLGLTPVGIEQKDAVVKEGTFSISSPVISNLTIDFGSPQQEESVLMISDLSGRTIYKHTIEKSSVSFGADVSSIPAGMYLATIIKKDSGAVETAKFVKAGLLP